MRPVRCADAHMSRDPNVHHLYVCDLATGHTGPHTGPCAGCLGQVREGRQDPDTVPVATWATTRDGSAEGDQ